MREIMRTNDIVALSFALSLLQDLGIETLVADAHISVMEGSIGIFPRRLHVLEDDVDAARAMLEEAGLGSWLVGP